MAKKAAAAAAAESSESATTQVNIADFQRTRDSVSRQRPHICLHSLCTSFASIYPWAFERVLTYSPPTSIPLHLRHYLCTMPTPDDNTVDLIDLSPEALANYTQTSQHVLLSIHRLATFCDRLATSLTTMTSPYKVADSYTQVIVALATLQSSVQDLSRAYINHANTVLAPGRGGALDSNLTNILSESGLLTGPGGAAVAAVVNAAEAPEAEGKKKRKRTPHDPNAPKRALTPYFLYMQSARAQIAKELGDQAKPKEVADEGTRRWTEMPQPEKAVSQSSPLPMVLCRH